MMTLFAFSDVVWQTLIQVGIGALVTVILAWMAQRTKNAVMDSAATAEKKADKVATTLTTTTIAQQESVKGLVELVQDSHSNLSDQVAEVHKLTNGLSERLQAASEKVGEDRGFTAGVKSETDKKK
jgi:hypothetical protein